MHLCLWRACLLAATMFVPCFAQAGKSESPIKLVETSIAGRITDQYGKPLRLPRSLHIVFFKFHQRAWSEAISAHIRTQPDVDGYFLATGVFPIDSVFMMTLVRMSAGREKAEIDVGLRLMDQSGGTLACPNGVRFEISRFGAVPWSTGKVAVIKGHLDDAGRMWPKMSIPIDAITLRNFTLLAQGRGM